MRRNDIAGFWIGVRVCVFLLCFGGLTLLHSNGQGLVSSLVAYWPLDGNLQDARSNFHGRAVGGPIQYVSRDGGGGFGAAIELVEGGSIEITGGNENVLELPNASMSISFWFRLDADDSERTLISKGVDESWRVSLSASGEVVFEYGTGMIMSGVLAAGVHHVVALVDKREDEIRLPPEHLT